MAYNCSKQYPNTQTQTDDRGGPGSCFQQQTEEMFRQSSYIFMFFLGLLGNTVQMKAFVITAEIKLPPRAYCDGLSGGPIMWQTNHSITLSSSSFGFSLNFFKLLNYFWRKEKKYVCISALPAERTQADSLYAANTERLVVSKQLWWIRI